MSVRRNIMIYVCTLILTTVSVTVSYACCEPPVASFTVSPNPAVLCETVSFDGSASYDPDETLVYYSWDFGADACNTTGQGTSSASAEYECIGAKTVRMSVIDNDKPECCGSGAGCSDKSDTTTRGVTVNLPSGCSSGTGSCDLESQIVGGPVSCPEGTCGKTQIIDISVDIDVVYDDCNWVFQVFGMADIVSGACPSNYCNIENGNEACITEDNYCAIVLSFKELTGCEAIGGDLHSNTNCVEQHEAKHVEIFQQELADEVPCMCAESSMDDIPIDCDDSTTTTCSSAYYSRWSAILLDVSDAYNNAWDNAAAQEQAAVDASRACLTAIADKICDHAASENWDSCGYCD